MPDFRRMPGFRTLPEMSGMSAGFKNGCLRGSVNNMLVFLSPELEPYYGEGAAVGSTGMKSRDGTNVDVYPVVVVAQHALGSIRLRGEGANGYGAVRVDILDKADKSDPTNNRIKIASAWYDAALVLAEEWMYRGEFGATDEPT